MSLGIQGFMSFSLRDRYLKDWMGYSTFTGGSGGRLQSVTDSQMILKFQGQEVIVHDRGVVQVEARWGQKWAVAGMKELCELFVPGDWLVFRGEPCLQEASLENLKTIRLAAPNQLEEKPVPRPHARRFSLFIEDVRQWFLKTHFFPASTPSLVKCPGMEPPLTPFQVHTDQRHPRFLPTSPELHLKKLLCRGYENIFEIKRVFRKEVVTPYHQPEFLMLEWYRSFSNLKRLIQDLKGLIAYLAEKGWNEAGLNLKSWSHLTVSGLFKEHLDFDLQPETSHGELLQLAEYHDVGFHCDDDTWDDTYFKIFLSCLETQIKGLGLITLCDYPPTQAALARMNERGWAERMEFYISGLEIGNAFDELNDPEIQRQRFEKDQQERRERGLMEIPLDEEFLNHLKMGLPPTAGIAIGLERLYMGLMGVESISELLEFPVTDPSSY